MSPVVDSRLVQEEQESQQTAEQVAEITRSLRTQTIESRDFLIVEASHSHNYYVQFPSPSAPRLPPGDLPVELYAEAVSNEFLEPPETLSLIQEETLRKLGWNEPGTVTSCSIDGASSPNWWRVFPLTSDDQFHESAEALYATLVEAYGHQGLVQIRLSD
jgi:hypothetical protein